MIGVAREDPAARVDALVAAIGTKAGPPVIRRRDVVLVTGPWLAGVSSVAAALRQRAPRHEFFEPPELAPGDAPTAVVFVVSAAAPLTESDCALLDAAAEHTDVVIGVVSKVDVHRSWRELLAADRATLAAHAPRYADVPWVGAAAAPQLGPPRMDDLVTALLSQLADPDIARRNRLRAWESRLQTVAQRFRRDAEGAGRKARVDALREERSAALRNRRQSKTEHAIALRGQVQQARVQLSYFARNRCSSIRVELQEDIAALPRRKIAEFEEHTRSRVAGALAEVSEAVHRRLADVAQALSVPIGLQPGETLPTVAIAAAPLKSRRLETRLMVVLGAGFGLGVALTLSRLLAGLAPRLNPWLNPWLTGAGIVACVTLGLALTLWVVHTRALLSDRAVLDRWTGDVMSALRSVLDELVAGRVLAAESLLSTALSARDEAEHARVAHQVSVIDAELREHTIAAARAAALRDRELPAIQAALDAVRKELREPGIPTVGTRSQGVGTAAESTGSRNGSNNAKWEGY
ncbi:hypothetical protein B4U45_15790 [Mycobacterium persicum]|uniref:Uncharacterized protein n=1 Tax=Mycobacterium persicum TaxID=1487726 RepID=A0A8E2IW06_9MYCO|nr:hypothetical protein [Mycobacterium persicum]ORC10327.1 hypothetical protein B4U45_15790 [Mycobacterium persicum]VAZ70876.1 hypothetical protein LAUMK15_00507 [Mycobacterium persicum]VAZ86956.1 hypothetical protein LAUMK4_00157 [Mycobacterium persicum]